ncbi:MAG: acetyl-CoA C-acyltransferase [Acidobacteria bacterium]|nr:acetyl-CoA C-acyltransferase [Acidobacteriota bacterium]
MSDEPRSLPETLPAPNHASAEEEVRQRSETVRTGLGPPVVLATGRRTILKGEGGRVAVVDGCRTPFARSGEELKSLDVVDLATVAGREVVARTGIDPGQIDRSIFGAVAPAPDAPNLGREVVLRAALPPSIPGSTVNLACASSARALVFGAQSILCGESRVVLAGGAESLSNIPVTFGHNAARRLIEAARTKSVKNKLSVLARLRLKDLAPVIPSIAEYSTGLTMGEVCERMAKENDVSRRSQDEIALFSHRRAWAAAEAGRLDEVVPTLPRGGTFLGRDGAVRPDTSEAALAALPPAFDAEHGSVTAGNSAPLADGAAALLLASEEAAKELGSEPLGYLRSFSFLAFDLALQPLQGPVYAMAQALDRAGLELSDIELFELHEAFGAQVLSNLKAVTSRRFAREELGRSEPLGEIDLERLNVNGGTLAFGHPFGATGARLVLQLLYEMRRRDLSLGMAAGCAAGAVSYALVLERP